MAAGVAGRGRPRQAKKWESTMRYDLFLSFSTNPDVHTALHMAGAEAPDLLITAMREYIERHGHPAGRTEVQTQAAMAGLGMAGQEAPVGPRQAPVTVSKPAASAPCPAPQATEPSDMADSPSAQFAQSQLDDA